MKTVFIVLFFTALIGTLVLEGLQIKNTLSPQTLPSPTTVPMTVVPTKKVDRPSFVFIPDWTNFAKELDIAKYERVIYFGLSADRNGLLNDQGSAKIAAFTKAAGQKEKWLTLRLLNTDENIALMTDGKRMDTVIKETIEQSQKYSIDGVVLDLEMSVLPLADVSNNITQFTQRFAAAAHSKSLKFAMTVYGDVFYRHRPYDVQKIATMVDEIIIMAYDFHKANGEPGPNFPLNGKEKFGYDFKQMTKDYLSVVPPDKISVTFGMYGYEWSVDEKQRPLHAAESLSYAEIKKKYIDSCDNKTCLLRRDELSAETEINYVQAVPTGVDYFVSAPHIIWFEDQNSVDKKVSFLLEKQIGSIGYWAYGYY